MAEKYKKIRAKQYPKYEQSTRKQGRYWAQFSFPVTVKEFSPITCIHFSPVKPYDFLVTCSSKIDIYSQATNQAKRSITKFKDSVTSGRYRNDGKLIVAGGVDKIVKVFDAGTKSSLRQFTGHTNAVHYTTFDLHGTAIFSGSDDATFRQWDLPTEKEVCIFRGHEDYVRTGAPSQASPHLMASGSYDHTVKLWDTRSKTFTLSLKHGDPVESVLLFPTGGLCVSAGSNVIKIWDILYGGRLLSSISNHTKTVTSLCLNSTSTQLLAGSLDRDVKIYNVTDYTVAYTVDYPSPVLSVAFSPDHSRLAVGMVDGLLSIKERKLSSEEQPSSSADIPLRKRQRKREDVKPSKDNFVVRKEEAVESTRVDFLLKNFEHKKALDTAIALYARNPGYVISVIRELARRDALGNSLDGRTLNDLGNLLRFIDSYITHPRYSGILSEVAHIVLDIYTPEIGKSTAVDRLLVSIRKRLKQELSVQRTALQLIGAMDTLLAVSALHSLPVTHQ